uniref:Reverse transcriptase domain-containing protein n=1 Tax=Micrurus corallinus TaxID=54390 RepID=A0A2D4EPT8_MICCO
MIQQIYNMNMGTNVEHIVTTIYAKQRASIIVNREMTPNIEIGKGVRQGCPLSPLLFIFSLEILHRRIRSNPNIKGLTIKKEEFKLQAFADDMVFFIEDPLETGEYLMKELERYGEVAGLKINKQKTKLLSKNLTKLQQLELEKKIGLESVKKIKYLGIWLTPRIKSLKKDNYDILIQQVKKDLELWAKLQISFLGRIAAIKMTILPKMLYLFQTIPIKLEKKFFEEMNKITRKFIWLNKKPRIKLKALQDIKSRGGMTLPNWELYYRSAVLIWTKEWINLNNRRILSLEGHDLQKGWHAFLWEPNLKKQQYFHRHLIRDSILQNWIKIKKKHYLKIPLWVSPIDIIVHPNNLDLRKRLKYKDILNSNGNMKTRDTNRLVDISTGTIQIQKGQ